MPACFTVASRFSSRSLDIIIIQQRMLPALVANKFNQFPAIHFWHVVIGNNQIEGMPLDDFRPPLAIFSFGNILDADIFKHPYQVGSCAEAVIHYQYWQIFNVEVVFFQRETARIQIIERRKDNLT